ncbi:MAG: DUF1801 domain-containing protein [Planctomycetes bacterium]|nr:DUF1801 domain-containing protein [Planctomycetota bacterium]
MQIKAATVDDYLAQLPDDRRHAIEQVRKVILKHIDKRIVEGIEYGMIAYSVGHAHYPAGYHCDPRRPLPFASIASQKNHIGLYLFCMYCDPQLTAWFAAAWQKAGKRLDMGKSCIRVKKLEDIPLDVVAELFRRVKIEDLIAMYESNLPASARKQAGGRSAAAEAKPAAVKKKGTSKKKSTASKKTAAKPAAKTVRNKPAPGKKAPARGKPARSR